MEATGIRDDLIECLVEASGWTVEVGASIDESTGEIVVAVAVFDAVASA